VWGEVENGEGKKTGIKSVDPQKRIGVKKITKRESRKKTIGRLKVHPCKKIKNDKGIGGLREAPNLMPTRMKTLALGTGIKQRAQGVFAIWRGTGTQKGESKKER